MPDSATETGVGPCAAAPTGLTLHESKSVGQPWMQTLARITMRTLWVKLRVDVSAYRHFRRSVICGRSNILGGKYRTP